MENLLQKQLINSTDKPSFYVKTGGLDKSLRCLLDTEADTPVFTLGEDVFKLYFPDAELQPGVKFELG